MQLQGRISELRTSADGTLFRLLGSDGSDPPIRYGKPLGAEFKNGDVVTVTGTNQTDPPFLADEVVKVVGKKTRSHTPLYVAIALALLLGCGLIYFLTRSSGNTWTITATDSGAPAANVPISLLNATKQPIKTVNTGTDGTASFADLDAGTYFASGPGSALITDIFTKKSRLTSPLPVKSPYTWTVLTTTCGRNDANNQLNLVSSSNVVLKTGVTDASGRFAFTDLGAGTYRVLAPGNLTATAAIDGTTAPPLAVIPLTAPSSAPCQFRPPYIFNHPLQMAPRAYVLQK